jgi:DNA-binding CsgD family transcriptional regulator
LALDLFNVPGFISDPANRLVYVNGEFSRLIGDPTKDGVPDDLRFIHGLVSGPYRDKFVQPIRLVANCLPLLEREIDAGNLNETARSLMDTLIATNPDLKRRVREQSTRWDGAMTLIHDDQSRESFTEHGVPIANPNGQRSGFHVSLWFSTQREPPVLRTQVSELRSPRRELTLRQLEIAGYYASGLNSRQVATYAGISISTARSHLEQIHSRLGVHSRAELTAVILRSSDNQFS